MLLRQTSLSANIVQFCRFLRGHGFTIGVEEQALALNALEKIDYSRREVFLHALQAILCRNQLQVTEFENLFNAYWKELKKALDSKEKQTRKKDAKPKGSDTESFKALKSWLHGNRNKEIESTYSYSLYESVSHKDFSLVPQDELPELMQYIRALAKRLAAQANRRYQPSHEGNRPDLRRTLRANMRRGGELLQLAWKEKKANRTKLVVICDVSQSMELYSAFLLQFMYAFQQAYARTKSFVFGTSLYDITNIMKAQNFSEAMKNLSATNSGWRGGTKIGECLADFVRQYGGRCIDKKTVVIILSDGWDQGDTTGISSAMQWIKTHAKKVLWLNPLMGNKDYKPQTTGMQAALPYVDILAAANNAQSLRNLARLL